MTTAYFVRHGLVENPRNVMEGRAPGFPLSGEGREKIEGLVPAFRDRGVGAVYSSPVLRCQETAEIIAAGLGLAVISDERLTEIKNVYEGTSKEEFNRRFAMESLYADPGQIASGERAQAVVGRMRAFLEEKLEEFAGRSFLAVSHADPIMLLWYALTGREYANFVKIVDEYIPRGGYFEFRFEGKKFLGERRSW